MTTIPNFDIAELFSNPDYYGYFCWLENQVKDHLSDEKIIEDFKLFESNWTEEDIRFVEWALYYFKLIGQRNNIIDPNSEVATLNEDNDLEEEDQVDEFLEECAEQMHHELEAFRVRHANEESAEEHSQKEDGESDFDKLLDKFIAKNLADSTEDTQQVLDFEGLEENFACKDILVRADGDSICKSPKFGQLSILPLLRREHFLHLKLQFRLGKGEPPCVEVSVQNYRCHTILRDMITSTQLKAMRGEVVVTFDIEDLFPKWIIGKDRLNISIRRLDTNEEVVEYELPVLCANSIFDTLRIERMSLFAGQPDTNPMNCDTSTGYISFVKSNSLQVNAHCYLASTTNIALESYDLQYLLYEQTGVLLEKQAAKLYYDHTTKLHAAYCGFNRSWVNGRYKLELTAFGKTVVVTSFKVGEYSLEGEVDVPQMISMLRSVEASAGNTAQNAMTRLNQMVGLKRIKEKVESLSRLSALAVQRKQMGLPVKGVPLHARFVGNPGTGKTTIAEIIGQIYKELGLLSSGHVIRVERKNLLGRYYDSEQRAIEQAIESAQGGVLFIDEAYNLYVPDDPRDPGKRVLESLLTALADENRRDWMLVLAGYPDEIEQLMNANPGIKSRVEETLFFDDYDVEELMQIADLYCKRNGYTMSTQARKHLESVVKRDYGARDKHFGNARYINNLMEQTIAANMARRVCCIENPTKAQLQAIEVEDIPSLREERSKSRGMEGLNNMVGLSNLKRNISQHLNMVKLANMRMKRGLHTEMPPLHMVFTGNPGTGKTTVADFLGEIYASMGLLSKGDVIRVEKSDLVGSHVGETERKMKSILNRAKGNILFIDEAYQLCAKDGQNDYGENVIDALLTTLSNDKVDMIVILAGYPKDMERLLDMNEGLRSRFPYTFHFEDYSVEELHKIALQRAKTDNYTFTKKAEELLLLLIKREVLRKRSSFGNARFVTRLLSTDILPRMATRLSNEKEPNSRQLKTIVAADIPITEEEAKRIEQGGFDNEAIDAALARLDALVGQNKVKRAIHNFVDIARYLNSEGEKFVGKGLLKWNFVGNTGTGKSIVAEILADILKAMNLLDKGNIVELRGEEIFNVSEYQCDQVLRQAMERSRHGLLFIDGDAPEFRNLNEYRMTSEQLRIKLTSLVAETGGQGALVIAECNSPRQTIANSLTINGIYDFDHTFFFDDYSSDELFEILCQRLAKHKVTFTSAAEAKIRNYIDSLCANKNLSFANARTMKHLARTIYEQVILRASRDKKSPRNRVLLEDVESYNWQQPRKLGY